MSVQFEFEWVDAGPSPDSASRDSMARLSIRAGDSNVTLVRDRRTNSYIDHVIVPLIYVAEWIATNWWHIWYETADLSNQGLDFESRHNLAYVGNGFCLPNITMISVTEERVNLRWKKEKPQYSQIEFVDQGDVTIDRSELDATLRRVVDAVLERFRTSSNAELVVKWLQERWSLINSIDVDEREFCRAVALTGRDPFDVPDPLADEIVEFWKRTDPSLRQDALACVRDGSLSDMRQWLDESLATLSAIDGGKDWSEVRARASLSPMPSGEPWMQGYDRARSIRSLIGNSSDRFDFPACGPLALGHGDTMSPFRRIQGLVASDAPSCITVNRHEAGCRFLRARALGDYMIRSNECPGVLCSLDTEQQGRTRAFAAEFLAPSESLRVRLAGTSVDGNEIDNLALEFGVSSQLIIHQLENHGLVSSRNPYALV